MKYSWFIGDLIAIGLIIVFNYGYVFTVHTCQGMYHGGSGAAIGVLFAIRLILLVVSCATVCMANCYRFQRVNGIMLVTELISCYLAVCICDLGLCIGGVVVVFMDSSYKCFHSYIGVILISSVILLAMVTVCRLMIAAMIFMSVPGHNIPPLRNVDQTPMVDERARVSTWDTSNIGSTVINR